MNYNYNPNNGEELNKLKEKFTLKYIDYKRTLLSISLTIILTSIFLALLNREVNSILLSSKFKLFFTNLSLVNVASINFSFESQFVNLGTISLAPRIIIYPLIMVTTK